MEPFFVEQSLPMDYSYSNNSNGSMSLPGHGHNRFASNDFEPFPQDFSYLYSSSASSSMSTGYPPSETVDELATSLPMDMPGMYLHNIGMEFQDAAQSPSYGIPIPRSHDGQRMFTFSPSDQSPMISNLMMTMSPRRGTTTDASELEKPARQYPCDQCGKSFTRVADVKRHQTSVHFPVLTDCPMVSCPRKAKNGFPRRDHLIEHLRSYHHMDIPKRSVHKRKAVVLEDDGSGPFMM